MEDENVNYPTTLSWTTDSLIPKREEIDDVVNDDVDVEDIVLTEDRDESPIEDEEDTELVDDLQDGADEVAYVEVDVKIQDLSPVLQLPTPSDSDHVEHAANTGLADVSIDTSTNQDTNNTAFKMYHYLDNMSMNGACFS